MVLQSVEQLHPLPSHQNQVVGQMQLWIKTCTLSNVAGGTPEGIGAVSKEILFQGILFAKKLYSPYHKIYEFFELIAEEVSQKMLCKIEIGLNLITGKREIW